MDKVPNNWGIAVASYPRNDSVHGQFIKIAKKYPSKLCLVFPGIEGTAADSLTYAQFDSLSNDIAEILAKSGVRPGDRVGFLMDRSLIQAAVIMAILKSGAAYVPIDSSYPADRISFMLQEAAIRLIVTSRSHYQQAEATGLGGLILDEKGGLEQVFGIPANVEPEAIPATPAEGTAYIMFTSGSTGKPKGVCIPHRGIVRLVRNSTFTPLGADRVFLQLAPVSFDAHTLEFWGPLLNGGSCILYPGSSIPDPDLLSKIISCHGVTTLWLTAALFNTLVQEASDSLVGIKELLVGGEALSIPHIRMAQEKLPEVQLVNGYGPTEGTTFTTCYRIPSPVPMEWTSIPIGSPIENTSVYILDEIGSPVPIGEPGELFIGGDGLASGYFGRSELTTEKFVPNPFDRSKKTRLYKTGDRVRWLDSGVIEFLGRLDDQVKLNGNRIELGEVKAALLENPDIQEALVNVQEVSGQRRLIAYYTPKDPQKSVYDLDAFLRTRLPPTMIPAFFLVLDNFPMTPNGKIDQKALPSPKPSGGINAIKSSEKPGDIETLEQKIAAIWEDLLGLGTISHTTPFFELGGTSLMAIKMTTRIKAILGLSLPITEVFKHRTVRGLATFLADNTCQSFPTAPSMDRQLNPLSDDPIAVIGMAGRFPGAVNVDEFWKMLLEGKASLRKFKRSELDPSLVSSLIDDPDYVMARGVLENVDLFDAEYFGILPREAEVMDPQQRVFLEVVVEALENAGYDYHRFPGEIGLFAGSGNTTYWHQHLLPRPDIVERAGPIAVRIGNEKDFLVTRVAHLLGLRGPALAINTACSTSLVAASEAFHSLRSGECDLALAGGVTIACPPNSGSFYQEGSMQSKDGYTRTFDVHAQGTSFNDGAAIVVLKRLSRAIADGDQIYAVMKGVGINNDGSDKMSFIAPSISGQATAIQKAHLMAGVSPESISYIEAHGTATPIGDPIEVAALTSVFRMSTDKVGFCALGSAKSNIGHTISAAGTVGLIKTALALKYRILPATAHFTAPNPQLQLEESPFRVVETTQPWERGSQPLRAGVSAFGWGGTNAHVILEEAPDMPPSDQEEGSQLLVLSARQPAALGQICKDLSDHLICHPDLSLPDVAFTLQTGRTSHACRTFVTGTTIAAAVENLRSATTKVRTRESSPRMAFLFPGQGSQYAGMGMNLYKTNSVYREAFDQCVEPIRSVLGEDLRQVLADNPEKLSRTRYTQPSLFAVMYALGRLWESFGIQPDAAIGHSIGEFAAACLAGVMDPADTAQLVALRGKLVDDCPPGGMMAVRTNSEELEKILPSSLEVAACNAPFSQVVAGPLADLDTFEKELSEKSISCRKLNTSHAFHSRMMDRAVILFQKEVSKIKLSAPRFPFVSTLTGTWIKTEEAMDPAYWGRHLRHSVQFSQATETLLSEKDWICLEVGPQATLSKLILQNPKAKGRTIVNSLSDSQESENSCITEALGALWRAGLEPDWTAGHSGKKRKKLPLPTYPFQRKRFWIDALPAKDRALPFSTPQGSIMENQNTKVESTMANSRKPQLLESLFDLLENLSGLTFSPEDAQLTYAELGMDSLQLTQAAINASKIFGVKLKLRHFVEEFPSPAALVDYLEAQVPAHLFSPVAPPVVSIPIPIDSAAPGPALTTPVGVAAQSMMPVMQNQLLPSASSSYVPRSSLEALFSQQMELMRQQLGLLSVAGASPGTIPAQVVPASIQPSAPNLTSTSPIPADTPAAKAPDPTLPVKGHGPQLVIDRTGKKELTPTQEKCRSRILARYAERLQKSKEFTQRNRSSVADPRTVAGFKPQMKEMIFPIVVEKSTGCHIWDLDGNEYVDLLSGYGSNFFGFGAPFVKAALVKQMEIGMEIGPQSNLIEDVSRLFREFVPMDRIAFCNTGSEAVLATLRMARTTTGKDLVVMFHGGYHGMFDEVVVRTGAKGKSIPAAPGIPTQSVENILLLDWASDDSLEIIRNRAGEIAAVVTEPVQSRQPETQPIEFLKKLRKITEEEHIALVFDEVVTGFRIAAGGAQEYFGIKADLATYGKVIGGGISIGIVAGKREYMDSLDGGAWQYGDASVPEVGVTYFAGTFVRHPLALAVTVAVLDKLKKDGPKLYQNLNEKTAKFAEDLNNLFTVEEAPVRLRYFGSIMKIDANHDTPFYELLFILLRLQGVHCWDGRPCFMTLSHTKADLDFVIKAFRNAIAELQEGGFYPTPTREIKADNPPVPGARLGRDPAGNPAWFIPDSKDPTQFIEVK